MISSLQKISLLTICLPAILFSQNFIEAQKVSSPGYKTHEYFGYSLSVSGDFAIVGTNDLASGTPNSSQRGSAYILKRDSLGVWDFYQKLRSSDKEDYDRFGEQVAIDGNQVMIGAYQHELDANKMNRKDNAGAIYYYEHVDDSTWQFKQKIVADHRSSFDEFGHQIVLKDSIMIVGARGDRHNVPGYNERNSYAGSVYIFKQDTNGIWNQFQKIVASDASHRAGFGSEVAYNGNYVIVGAPEEAYSGDHGAAYIFRKDSSGYWHETQKMIGHNPKYLDAFGRSIGIQDSSLMICAYLEEVARAPGDTIKDAGAVYAYSLQPSGEWKEIDRMTACGPMPDGNFGFSISMLNDRAIIGSPMTAEKGHKTAGSAYFYYKTKSGYWQQTRKVIQDEPYRDFRFGKTTAMSEDCFIIGANRSGLNPGSGKKRLLWGDVYFLSEFPMATSCMPETLATFVQEPNLEAAGEIVEFDTTEEETINETDSTSNSGTVDTSDEVEKDTEPTTSETTEAGCKTPIIKVTPNPSDGKFSVEIVNFNDKSRYKLKISAPFMGTALSQDLSARTTQIEMDESARGPYVLSVSNECGETSIPIIVRKLGGPNNR